MDRQNTFSQESGEAAQKPTPENKPGSEPTGRKESEPSFVGRPYETYAIPTFQSADEIAAQLKQGTISAAVVTGILFVIEIAAILISGIMLFADAGVLVGSSLWPAVGTTLLAATMYGFFAHAINLYSVSTIRETMQQIGRLAIAWLLVMGAFAVVHQMMPHIAYFDLMMVSPWFLTAAAFLFVTRLLASYKVRQWTRAGLLERRAVIVGGGIEAEEVIKNLESDDKNDVRICGIFDDRTDSRSPDLVAGYPKLGTIAELIEFARNCRLDMLIVSLPITAEGRVREMLKKLWVLPVDIRLSAHRNKVAINSQRLAFEGRTPMLRLTDRPLSGWNAVKKRIFDIVVSFALIILTLPIMLVTALIVKFTSKGPILFKQMRHGFNNESIKVLKFRSMYVEQSDPDAKVVVTKDDPRVTPFGRFIRRTSIDELPQLFNVLFGQLSLVGPRPHAVHAHLQDQPWNEVVDGYYARHRVLPGVTGWAQINGWRGEVDTPEKIKARTEYDLYYIENWSVMFDIKILLLTPWRLIKGENAY